MKAKPILLALTLLSSISIAVANDHASDTDKAADAMLASMEKADMTYRELMELFGQASSLMNEGIIRQNKQMVQQGANIILTHPAPKHKPWAIVPKDQQVEFKKSLLAFDKLLDSNVETVIQASSKSNWQQANKNLAGLNTVCISCHAAWKNKAIDISKSLKSN